MNYFEIFITLNLGIIFNFLLSIIFIKIIKVKLFSFILSLIISISLFIFVIQSFKLSDFELLIIVLFYTSLCLFIIWFYYTFAQGFSSRVLENVFILKTEKKVIQKFKDKKFKNLILAERIPYLVNRGFLLKKKDRFKVSNKGLIICKLHKLICRLMNIKMGGGLLD